jgi:hypothetical protein
VLSPPFFVGLGISARPRFITRQRSAITFLGMPLRMIAGRAAVILGLCSLVAAIMITGRHLEQAAYLNPNLSPPPIYLPETRFLRLVSLGYENVLADLLWFRTISYFGEHYRSDRVYSWLAQMCDRVTDLDPRAFHVYRFAGMVLPWEAREVDEGLRLLEKGTRVFPNSWLLRYWLGFEYFLFKDDYKKATTYLEQAARLPGSPASVARLLVLFHQRQYGPQTTVEFLNELTADPLSEDIRQVLDQSKKEAQLAADLEYLNAAVARYEQRFRRPPQSLHDLLTAGLLPALPQPPFGGHYQIASDTGEVTTSAGHRPPRLYRSRVGEELLRGRGSEP